MLDKVEKDNNKLNARIESYKLEKSSICKDMTDLTIELEKTKEELEKENLELRKLLYERGK